MSAPQWKPCFSFSNTGVLLALETSFIGEIVRLPAVTDLGLPFSIGAFDYRGFPLRVLDMNLLMNDKKPRAVIENRSLDVKRVIIVKNKDQIRGLLVDSIEYATSFDASDIMPLLFDSAENDRLYKGVVTLKDRRKALLLNPAELFAL